MAQQSSAEPEAILAQINRDHGTDYALDGKFSGGLQGGAWRIVGPGGDMAVLKWVADRPPWRRIMLAAEAKVAAARQHGYPTPAWLAAGATHGVVYQVREYADGWSAERLTERLARQSVDVLERCAAGHRPEPHGDPRSDWSQFVLSRVSADAQDGLFAQVCALGTQEAEVAQRALALLERFGPGQLSADDLVHGDFNLDNVLIDAAGGLVGIVDVEALGAGSRAIDYATLWHSSGDKGEAEALRLVRAAGERAAGADGFALCALWVMLEYVTFGAALDGSAGSGRAVAAAHRRLNLLEVPLP